MVNQQSNWHTTGSHIHLTWLYLVLVIASIFLSWISRSFALMYMLRIWLSNKDNYLLLKAPLKVNKIKGNRGMISNRKLLKEEIMVNIWISQSGIIMVQAKYILQDERSIIYTLVNCWVCNFKYVYFHSNKVNRYYITVVASLLISLIFAMSSSLTTIDSGGCLKHYKKVIVSFFKKAVL